ncbi:hypothetical protein [Litorilituus lipolyticus]|uniref:Uncharacterized protein n=1 Tax=Litorilituus lipolyticus TaxID=2491017 RepID=A0A502KLR5_9GAMM|nr:hypothetical protein [Litorilituus lipolyticus]TPH12558.1 hypothetical protein EPA86_16590 [Litorilituus lipolyticus]
MIMSLIGFIGYQLVINTPGTMQSHLLKVCLLSLLWLLLFYTVILTFSGDVQSGIKSTTLFGKLKAKIVSFTQWLLTVLFIMLTIATLLITSRMANVI